ncbi:hypothetical protein GobsT_59690 [Gemmata obscuriglobus]|uniref:DUF4034 domain-containing protein n=1 Tax=Gemmata obscuriglobus TaxID=114 RepID=A0A2Z3GPN0_9BACT|nr:hypothetical protein [Gemmata obscuriglobus]AWM36249.1 hypothetical protein C1280_03955 [Gemmata obscuriglobus]QEG31148.1 hypothetical protein GobsT_59690 [Gemmata obscuriglobus]VTS10486.1 hypothetical protein : [Gemmata obscuriglobus UQM 2246]
MASSRLPPWTYAAVVVVCGLGTFALVGHFLGLFRSPAPVARAPVPDRLRLPSPIDPNSLPPHRAAKYAAARAALVPAFEAAFDGPVRIHDTVLWAVEDYALFLAHPHPPDALVAHCREALRRAVIDGCKDPFVTFAEWRVDVEAGTDTPGESGFRFAEALGRTKYPAVYRLEAHLDAMDRSADLLERPPAERVAAAGQARDTFWVAFAEAARDPSPVAEALLLAAVRELVGRDAPVCGTPEENYKRATAALAAAGAREHVRLTLDGFDAARAGRAGTGPVARAALERARTAFQRAWELEPACPAAPTELIAVTAGLGLGADEARRWFARAIEADPDNPRAWAALVDAVGPDRGGAVPDALAVARSCRERGAWDAGVPAAAAVAFDVARRHRPNFLTTADGWAEVQTFFDAWLAARPADWHARTLYARLATDAERYEIAVPLFDALKDRPRPGVFAGPSEYAAAAARSRGMIQWAAVGVGAAPYPGYMKLGEPARRAAARAARRGWFARTYRDSFNTAYPADGPGRAEALAALNAVADAEAPGFLSGGVADAAWEALERAVAAGCDDPLVATLHARFGAATGLGAADGDKLRKAAARLAASRYPVAVRLPAALSATDRTAGGSAEQFADLWPLFTSAAADPDPTARQELLRAADRLLVALPAGRAADGERLSAALAAGGDAYGALVVSAAGLITAGWAETAGPRRADAPRLREASALLERAWRLAPERPEAPTRMLAVATGLREPRSVAERWFVRAAAADPDNYEAVRWFARYRTLTADGNDGGQALFAVRSIAYDFGRWEGGFGLLASEVDASLLTTLYRGRLDNPLIWQQMEQPLQTWTQADPACRYAKTVYAQMAARAGQHVVANRLFRQLAGRPWPGVFTSPEAYREAAERSRRAAGGVQFD